MTMSQHGYGCDDDDGDAANDDDGDEEEEKTVSREYTNVGRGARRSLGEGRQKSTAWAATRSSQERLTVPVRRPGT